jgi:dsDNA-binding SOS-regulon protein
MFKGMVYGVVLGACMVMVQVGIAEVVEKTSVEYWSYGKVFSSKVDADKWDFMNRLADRLKLDTVLKPVTLVGYQGYSYASQRDEFIEAYVKLQKVLDGYEIRIVGSGIE